ncbi:OmpH/Skp family outer membrane protein [Denitratisoma sp. agr-D3]
MTNVMKNALMFSLAALMLVVAGVARAEGKIGIINIEKVMRDSDPAKKAMKKLEKEFEKRGQDLEKVRQQAQKLQEDIEKNGVTLGESARKQKERELADATRDFQRKQRELNEDFNARRNEELQAVVDRTNKAIRVIAEKEGFDLVLQEAAYVNPRVDITEKVIKALADGK